MLGDSKIIAQIKLEQRLGPGLMLGTIELGRSKQDPLYKLPVRKVLGGMFIEFGTIEQPAGEVLKRYTPGGD